MLVNPKVGDQFIYFGEEETVYTIVKTYPNRSLISWSFGTSETTQALLYENEYQQYTLVTFEDFALEFSV